MTLGRVRQMPRLTRTSRPSTRPGLTGAGAGYAEGGRCAEARCAARRRARVAWRAMRRRANRSRARRCSQVTGTAAAKPRASGRAGLEGSSRADSRPAVLPERAGPRRGSWAAAAFSLGLLEGGGNRQDPPPAGRPDDDEGPADHGVLRDRAAAGLAEVVPRVVGDEPVVSHDPQPAGRDDDVEPDLGGGIAGVQVGLLGERDAVDRDPALRVAAGHLVTGQADDPLDEDVSRVPEAEHAGKSLGELHHEVGVPGRRARVPRAVPVEDHDVAAVDAADVVDELVDQHPVVDLERVLHRPGRDEEGLDRVGLDDDREQQGDDDQDRELAPERPLPPSAAAGRLAAAAGFASAGGPSGPAPSSAGPLGSALAPNRPALGRASGAVVRPGSALGLALWSALAGRSWLGTDDAALSPWPASGSAPGVTPRPAPLIRAPSVRTHRVPGTRPRSAGRPSRAPGSRRLTQTHAPRPGFTVIESSLAPNPGRRIAGPGPSRHEDKPGHHAPG